VGGHACGIEKGTGWCRGHGELGSRRQWQWLPASPVAIDGPRQLAAGDDHGCGLRGDGKVLCWGRNDKGQLGDGTLADRKLPAVVLGVETAVQIAVGYDHSCALRRDGKVLCWGYNAPGELGPAAGDWFRPAKIPRPH